MKSSIKVIISTFMFSVLLAGCNIEKDYVEYADSAVVTDYGQCDAYSCAYIARIDGKNLHMVASFPTTMGAPIPVTVRKYNDGRVEYYTTRRYNR